MTPQTAKPRIEIPQEALAEFCRHHYILKMSLFGSVLRDDFTSQSDVDVLVQFDLEHHPGLVRLGLIELELSKILGGRKAHISTAEDLSKYFRQKVVSEAQVQYVFA